MNRIIKIILRRSLQIAIPVSALWTLLQRFRGRPARMRAEESLFFSGAMALYFATLFFGSLRIGYPRLMTCLPRGRRAGSVALTFDDGPHPETTPQILDILRAQEAHATFFILTEQAVKYPGLIRRIVEEGHTLGLHGIQHDALALCTQTQVAHILRLATRDLVPAIPEIRYFRPPYGFKSQAIQRACDQMGMTLTTWSVDPRDYFNRDAAEITRRVLRRIKEGDIVLLHDARPETVIALPALLKRLAGLSLRPVRL